MTEIGIEQARKSLGDIANRAAIAGTITYLTRNGRRVAAVVPLERIVQTVAEAAENAYVVVVEAAGDDPAIWQAIEAAQVVHGYPRHGSADDIAEWVFQNQTVATGPGAARIRVWKGDDTDVVHSRPADAEREIPAAQMFAKYTQEGRVSIVTGDDEQIADLGYFDADGGTWEDEVREIVRAAGWEPVSGWDNTRVGEDNEDNSTMVVKNADTSSAP
jgi:antitoxin (DNA-binding transcriptional repressor) of toxin-antitoxin stability system